MESCLENLYFNISICSLLSDPNMEQPLVPQIAETYRQNKQKYEKKIKQWIQLYANESFQLYTQIKKQQNDFFKLDFRYLPLILILIYRMYYNQLYQKIFILYQVYKKSYFYQCPLSIKTGNMNDFMQKSYRRLLKQQTILQKYNQNPPCISGVSNKFNIYHWNCFIKGPEGTPYQQGQFQVEFIFPKDYPAKSPKIKFITKIYHPNINANGNLEVDFLRDMWSPAWTILTMLLGISSLLNQPNFDHSAVPQISQLYATSKQTYFNKAKQWTQLYAKAYKQSTLQINCELTNQKIQETNKQ